MRKSRQVWPGAITSEVTDPSVGALFDRSCLTGAAASTRKENNMGEEGVPTVEAKDQSLGPHQQARVPYQMRKGYLPELKIPKRQVVLNDKRGGTVDVSNNPSDVVVKVRQSSRRGERKPMPKPQITVELDLSHSQKEAPKMPEGIKRSTTWGRIFSSSVCFGGQVRHSQPDQRRKGKPRRQQKRQSATDRNSKGERGDKKQPRRQPAARTNSSETLQQRAASKLSYDDNLTSSTQISYGDISEKGSKQSLPRTSSAGQNIARLRDYYVQMMLKMADFSSQHGSGFGAGHGVHVDSDSMNFESEIFRKKCAQEADMVEHYWQNSIRPDEWNDAKLGNIIAKHFSV